MPHHSWTEEQRAKFKASIAGQRGWSRGRTLIGDDSFDEVLGEGYGLAMKGRMAAHPLRAWRSANDLSVKQLADKSRIPASRLAAWDTGHIPDHGIDMLYDRMGIKLGDAMEAWSKETFYALGSSISYQEKYRRIGHALIETERIQRELRLERKLEERHRAQMARRRNCAADELAILNATMESLRIREITAERKRLVLVAAKERTQKALDAIKRDEDEAAEWMAKHADELEDFKPDWKLYYGVPIVGDREEAEERQGGGISESFLNARIVDSTGHLMLEDAVIAKIDKEREGYFVKIDYNSRNYGITLLHGDDAPIGLRTLADTAPLDDVRREHAGRFDMIRRSNPGLRKSVGEHGHDSEGHAGRDFDRLMQEDAARLARKRELKADKDTAVAYMRRRAGEILVVPSLNAVPPMEHPAAPRVLPEGVDPMDLAIVSPDRDAWRREINRNTVRGGVNSAATRNRRKKASQR